MKKLFSVLAVATLAVGIVAGCGKEEKKDTATSQDALQQIKKAVNSLLVQKVHTHRLHSMMEVEN